MYIQEFISSIPEWILVVSALCLLMLGVFQDPKKPKNHWIVRMTYLSLMTSFVLTFYVPSHHQSGFFGLLTFNYFTQFMKQIILVCIFSVIYMSSEHLKKEALDCFEYYVLLLLMSAGMLFMISSCDLISLFISLELQSLSLYILLAFQRKNPLATESALKYFILSVLSTAFILYGSSLIFGYCGDTQFSAIATLIKGQTDLYMGVKIGILMVLFGFGFKISLAPFHMWIPDTYQGSPTPVTALISTAPKIAAFAVVMQLIAYVFDTNDAFVHYFIYVSAVASILIGTYAALIQKSIKRLLAFSTVSHMGYALLGLVTGQLSDGQSVLNYLCAYAIMTVTAFACLLSLRRHGKIIDQLVDLVGLSTYSPLIAATLTIVMLSYAGIPPMAGFFIKFNIFSAILRQEYYGLALVGVLTSVVSAAYYLKVVKIIYFDKIDSKNPAFILDQTYCFSTYAVMTIGAVLTLVYSLQSEFIHRASLKAINALSFL